MVVTGIVAVARNLAIGKDGKLPWHYSNDLKFFKETTMGHAVLMGANTWRSIGRALPGRVNVVLSRSGNIEVPDDVRVLAAKNAAMTFAEQIEKDLFIIGGAEIFKEFASDIDQWIVTEVPVTVDDADVFMPRNFLDGFKLETVHDLGGGLVAKSYTRA